MSNYAARYQKAGEEGFLKLVYGKNLPMLKDFFVTKDGGDIHFKSWVYYGAGGNLDNEYFLRNHQKNANYHLYDMELIFSIGKKMPDDFDWSQFEDKQLDGKHTALGGMLEVYDNKMAAGGLEVDTPTKYGEFTQTLHGENDALKSEVTDWYGLWD